MKSTTLIVAAGALALFAGSAALAQGMRGPGGPGGPGFGGPGAGLRVLQAADADGDRSIARAEIDALAAEEFAWRDRNGDGALDEGDMSPTARRLIAQRQADAADDDAPRRDRPGRADADDDGRVTQAEFMAAETRIFERIDADSDGVITPDELDANADARRDRGRWWRAR